MTAITLAKRSKNAERCRRYRINRHDRDMLRDMVATCIRDMMPEIIQQVTEHLRHASRHATDMPCRDMQERVPLDGPPQEENPPHPLKTQPLPLIPSERISPASVAKSARREFQDEFDEIWQLFPRKRDKGHALKAFIAERKTTALDVIEAGIRRFAKESAGKDAEFIAYPATWLRGQRWLDQDAKPTPATPRPPPGPLTPDRWEQIFGKPYPGPRPNGHAQGET